MPTVSADGLTYSIRLRQGIKFHNGKEMTSDDVVASLKRWMQQGQYGRALATVTADVKATGKYAIELKLKQKYAGGGGEPRGPQQLRRHVPEGDRGEVPPAEKVTEFVGTGPYKLAEWKPDQHIRMVRFDDYKSRTEKTNGYGGAKTVWVDEIRWIPVRTSPPGWPRWRTGELEFADDLNIDASRSPAEERERPPGGRQAVLLAGRGPQQEGGPDDQPEAAPGLAGGHRHRADHEGGGRGGGRSSIACDSGLAFVENAPWYVKPQSSWGWNEHNKEKAKKLMQEAGYKGEPVRFVTTQEYKWMYDFALLSKQQLEDVGFNIDLQVVDWATLVKRRNNPKEYEAFTTGTGNIFEPTAFTVLSCTWPGWTCDADIQGLLQEMAKETDQKKRFALWEQMHRLWYEKVPSIRYGDLHGLRAASKKLQGFNEKTERPRFYNVWLER